jgi:hypothetical protein
MQRPHSHVQADIGVANVTTLFAQAGWACDRVMSDYGEDLIVQTTLGGNVDPFRTLVQVKATARMLREPRLKIWRVNRSHALRWVRNADPVLLVVWHVPSGQAWWAIPRDKLEEYALLVSDQRTVAIEFDEHSTLSVDNLKQLAWRLRLDYFKQRILAADRADRDYLFAKELGEPVPPKRASASGTVAFEFLRLVGIITVRGVSSEFRRWFRNGCHKFRCEPGAEISGADADRMAVILCLLVQVNKVTGQGMPRALLDIVSDRLLYLLKLRRLPRPNL